MRVKKLVTFFHLFLWLSHYTHPKSRTRIPHLVEKRKGGDFPSPPLTPPRKNMCSGACHLTPFA